jgi:hypothetical protein
VLPPNFRDVTAEHIGTIIGIVGAPKAALPIPSQWASGVERRSCEDTLDAVVCAWVAPRMGHDLPAEIDEVRARQVALGVIGAPAADFKIGEAEPIADVIDGRQDGKSRLIGAPLSLRLPVIMGMEAGGLGYSRRSGLSRLPECRRDECTGQAVY